MNKPEPPRTQVKIVIVMDSGNSHIGYLSAKDLKLVRKAMEGEGGKTTTVLLYRLAEGGTNENLQLVSAKIESLTLL